MVEEGIECFKNVEDEELNKRCVSRLKGRVQIDKVKV